MHILFIHQNFAVPDGTCCVRSYEFARRWVKAGHKVTVITGFVDRGGLKPSNRLLDKQQIDGINLLILKIKYGSKLSVPRRMISMIGYVLLCTYYGISIKSVDVIYTLSPPLTTSLCATALKWLKRKPLVFTVMDQWPEIPIEMGYFRNKLLIKILLWWERMIYRNSSAIIAFSPGQEAGVRKVAGPAKKIAMIPNGCETEQFSISCDRDKIRAQYSWGDKLVFLHAGAMGRVNSLHFVIDAAQKLKECNDFVFVLVGEGIDKESLEERVKDLGLRNVEVYPSVPQKDLPQLYAAVDVGMVIIGNFSIVQHNSASKFFDTLAAGKPVLINYSGWQRDVIESTGCGFGCKLCNIDEFVEKVSWFRRNKAQLEAMGHKARQVGIEKYDRQKLAMKTLNVFDTVISNKM